MALIAAVANNDAIRRLQSRVGASISSTSDVKFGQPNQVISLVLLDFKVEYIVFVNYLIHWHTHNILNIINDITYSERGKMFGDQLLLYTQRLYRYWDFLTHPADSLSSKEKIQSRFLMATVLAGMVLNSLLLILYMAFVEFKVFDIFGGLATNILLLFPYFLCRRGKIQWASILFIAGSTGAVYLSIFGSESGVPTDSMPYLILPIFLATIMFQPIIVFGIGIANILLLVMISVLKKDFTIGTDVYDPFTFFVVSFVIILALTWFRNEYEHLRQHDLSASEARYRGIFDASDDAILIHDMGQVIEVNAAFKRLLEMEFTEIQEWKMLEKIHPNPLTVLNNPDEIVGEKQYKFELTQDDGQVVPIEVYAKPILFGKRELRMIVVRDMTIAREAEQRRFELSLAKERTQLLEEFVSNLSHDLRTPLNVMRTTIAIIEMTDDESEKLDNMELLKRQIDHFERLFKQILTISRLDYAPQTEFSAVNINQLLETITQRFGSEFKRKSIKLELDLADDASWVEGDATSLQRVFTNLIENGINYSPKGTTLKIATTNDTSFLKIVISDNGSGIDPEDLPHIFDRFYRGQKSKQQIGTGTGLGLAIVKGIVELHNGQIDLQSALDKGTTIHISLPVAKTTASV